MAKIDSQVDLVRLWDIELVSFVLHVDSNELIADLWCMFSVVHKAELFSLHLSAKIFIFLDLDALRFNLLLPTDFVQALSEKDHVHEDYLVKVFIDLLWEPVQVESKDFINKHLLAILFTEIVVWSLPLLSTLLFFFFRRISTLFGSLLTTDSFSFRLGRELSQILEYRIISIGLVLFVSFEELFIDWLKVS